MSTSIPCECGQRIETDEAEDGLVTCSACGRFYEVGVTPRPSEPPMPARPSFLAYAPPARTAAAPARLAEPGQRLADDGWRIGAVIVCVGCLARAVQAFSVTTTASAMGNSETPPLTAALSVILAVPIAIGLWNRRAWARWVMIVMAVLAGFLLAWAGQDSHVPGGPVTWYVVAAGLVASWILLLERPTNQAKLAAGIILVILTEATIFVLPMLERAR